VAQAPAAEEAFILGMHHHSQLSLIGLALVKQNEKAKKCAVFCFAGKRKLLFLYL
jgi:hypothetical protein